MYLSFLLGRGFVARGFAPSCHSLAFVWKGSRVSSAYHHHHQGPRNPNGDNVGTLPIRLLSSLRDKVFNRHTTRTPSQVLKRTKVGEQDSPGSHGEKRLNSRRSSKALAIPER